MFHATAIALLTFSRYERAILSIPVGVFSPHTRYSYRYIEVYTEWRIPHVAEDPELFCEEFTATEGICRPLPDYAIAGEEIVLRLPPGELPGQFLRRQVVTVEKHQEAN